MKKYLIVLAMLLTTGLTSLSVNASGQAKILWADRNGIETWKVVDNHTLHIQDQYGQWFEAELYHNVPSLDHAITLGFVTGIMGELDKFSSIYFEGNNYRFKRFIQLEEDPYTEEAEDEPGAKEETTI